MGTCRCAPPATLHIRPDGVHLPGGVASAIVVVEEAAFEAPVCSVCSSPVPDVHFRCSACDALICRGCVALDTDIVECDCAVEVHVTGVQLAAIRAAAALR